MDVCKLVQALRQPIIFKSRQMSPAGEQFLHGAMLDPGFLKSGSSDSISASRVAQYFSNSNLFVLRRQRRRHFHKGKNILASAGVGGVA
jgi:hypothetical protein